MTVEELGAQYRASAEPLRKRLHELRQALKMENDPEKRFHLKRRIADLAPVLTQCNEVAWLCENYYKIGGADRNDRYGFCGKSPARIVESAADGDTTSHLRKRVHRLSALNVCGLSLSGEADDPDRKGTGSAYQHHQPDSKTRGAESEEVHEVRSDWSQFFDSEFQ